jgi:hypothetical protein
MINPDNDFLEEEPLSTPPRSDEGQIETGGPARPQRITRKISARAGDTWEQTKEKATSARERTELFLRENPVPTILGALTIGLAIGLAIRYASAAEEKELKTKTPFGDLHWGFLSLPFLWPFFKSMKEKYEDSAEAVKHGVGRVRDVDLQRYTKPIRKRWKNWTH